MPLGVEWPFPPSARFTRAWNLASRITMAGVGLTSKMYMGWLNKTTIHNKEVLYRAIENRERNRPLITVCNHHSCLDEPLIWGMLKWRHHSTHNHVMRWSLGASDVCFTKELHSKFFALGRTVPVCRGDGVYQRSMDFVVELLNMGAWVHVFPEGRINDKHQFIRLKWGVGRAIAESKITPLVVPFYHLGMDDILPNRAPYRPKINKKVTILIGRCLEYGDMLQTLKNSNKSDMEIRKTITDQIQTELLDLEKQALELHGIHSNKSLHN